MDKKILKAEERKISGRKVKTIRVGGFLPGNVYGKNIKSLSVQVDKKEFASVYKEVGETGLIMLQVGKDELPVLVNNVQKHPITDESIHVDFRQVDLKVKVSAKVPVEVVGESPAEKQSIGTVVQYLNEVEVEALPADLPEKFEVDTSNLSEVDQAIHVKDLKVDSSKIEIKTNLEEIVVKVDPPQKEEEVVAPIVAVGAEGEVPAEGAIPAEGEATEAPKEEAK
ncbi:MAG TPA: 50S ribosomal protein L25 [Patescibacteria group bacterium]|nr:50S ribosomal protein L25 [Patescibacteria group bacterium]